MGCSCLLNNNENEIINPFKIEEMTSDFPLDISQIKLNQAYPENISYISSTIKSSHLYSPSSKIPLQELITLLNTLPPLEDKTQVELHLPIKYESRTSFTNKVRKSS